MRPEGKLVVDKLVAPRENITEQTRSAVAVPFGDVGDVDGRDEVKLLVKVHLIHGLHVDATASVSLLQGWVPETDEPGAIVGLFVGGVRRRAGDAAVPPNEEGEGDGKDWQGAENRAGCHQLQAQRGLRKKEGDDVCWRLVVL